MYRLKYWFEHGGGCLWSDDDFTRDKLGYKVDCNGLLSFETQQEIEQLEKKFAAYMNWDNPSTPLSWSVEEKKEFIVSANAVYERIKRELGDNYSIKNMINSLSGW